MADGFRQRFLGRIKQLRPTLTDADLKTIADGRIVAAPKALTLHMVDQIGYLHDALGEARRPGRRDGRRGHPLPSRRTPRAVALRDRAEGPPDRRGGAVQLPRTRPGQAAGVPLSLAARPDPAPDHGPVSPNARPLAARSRPRGMARAGDRRRRVRRRPHRQAAGRGGPPRPRTLAQSPPSNGPAIRPSNGSSAICAMPSDVVATV